METKIVSCAEFNDQLYFDRKINQLYRDRGTISDN